MTFTDLHNHLLCGVDDGAANEKEMQDMLDAAYADGTRIICATPHFHPGYFGDNREAVKAVFTKLKRYANKYDDMKLYCGCELRYSNNCLDWLKNGDCMTINGSRYLLVDFAENADAEFIVASMFKILNAGYIPILAHAERYEHFHRDMREIQRLQECGAVIQVDAQSLFGGWGPGSKKRGRKLVKRYYADLIASDAHNLIERPPQMSRCCEYVSKKCGAQYAERILMSNPLSILNDSDIRKDLD